MAGVVVVEWAVVVVVLVLVAVLVLVPVDCSCDDCCARCFGFCIVCDDSVGALVLFRSAEVEVGDIAAKDMLAQLAGGAPPLAVITCATRRSASCSWTDALIVEYFCNSRDEEESSASEDDEVTFVSDEPVASPPVTYAGSVLAASNVSSGASNAAWRISSASALTSCSS